MTMAFACKNIKQKKLYEELLKIKVQINKTSHALNNLIEKNGQHVIYTEKLYVLAFFLFIIKCIQKFQITASDMGLYSVCLQKFN